MAKYTIDDIARLTNEDVREHNVPVFNESKLNDEELAALKDSLKGKVPPRFAGKNREGPPRTDLDNRESVHERRRRAQAAKADRAAKEGDKPAGSGKGNTFANKMKRKDLARTGKHDVPHRKQTAAQEKQERRNKKQLANLHGVKKGSKKDKEEPKPLTDSINRLMYMLQEAETKIISTRERNKSDQDFEGGLVGPAMTWFKTQYNRLKARFNGGSNNPEFQKAVAALKRKADEAKLKGAADFHDEPGIAGPGNQHTNDMHSKHHPVNGPADPDPRVSRMLQRRRYYETRKQGKSELDRRGIDAPPDLLRGFNKRDLDDALEKDKLVARQREQDARDDEHDRQHKLGRYKEDSPTRRPW